MIKQHKCPICGKETTDEKYRPFCSKRCADVDLGHWFNGSYIISADKLDDSALKTKSAQTAKPIKNS